MKTQAGPTGEFQFGQPMEAGDKGSIYIGFKTLKPHKQAYLKFGTAVHYLLADKDQALALADAMERAIIKDFGKLPYNKAELPIVVQADNNMVRIVFPIVGALIIANPEMFLALAEVMREEANKIRAN
jgi:hypothetical protein